MHDLCLPELSAQLWRRCGSRSAELTLIHGAGAGRASSEGEHRLRLACTFDQVGDMVADDRAVLESVSRAATRTPDAVVSRKAIEQQVAVAGVLVLADTRFHEWRVCERRQAALQGLAHPAYGLSLNRALHRFGIGFRAVGVDRNLHAALLEIR